MNPYAQSPEDEISALGEASLIEQIKAWLGSASPDSPEGIGDDCSAVALPRDKAYLLTTADPVIYQSHFDDRLAPENVAAKLLRRNVSDIASMGGAPRHATLSLAIPSNLSLEWLRRFYTGLSVEANRWNVQINGGDLTPTKQFIGAFLTLIGYANDRILERKGASPGSTLCVTGTLGGTRLKKHYSFEPRLPEGQWLASHPSVSSCMDVSDGLGKDCPALLFDHCAVVIDSERVPISQDAHAMAAESGRSLLDHAFNDGEDYELLFTLEPGTDLQQFEAVWKAQFKTRLSYIGHIETRAPGQPPLSVSNARLDFNPAGYDPFRSI